MTENWTSEKVGDLFSKNWWESVPNHLGDLLAKVIDDDYKLSPSSARSLSRSVLACRHVIDNVEKGGHVLDIACGVGQVSICLAEHGYDVAGFDASEAGIGKAREVAGTLGQNPSQFAVADQGYLKDLKTVVKFRTKHQLYFLIAYPRIKCSTKEVYSKVKKYHVAEKFLISDLRIKSKFINYIKNSKNDLQSIVEKKHPLIKKLIIAIRNEEGCCFSRMTGSGSVCYGLFKDQIGAKKALNKLKIKFPKFWFSFAKTV